MKSKKLSSETSLSENGNSCAVVVCLFVCYIPCWNKQSASTGWDQSTVYDYK